MLVVFQETYWVTVKGENPCKVVPRAVTLALRRNEVNCGRSSFIVIPALRIKSSAFGNVPFSFFFFCKSYLGNWGIKSARWRSEVSKSWKNVRHLVNLLGVIDRGSSEEKEHC